MARKQKKDEAPNEAAAQEQVTPAGDQPQQPAAEAEQEDIQALKDALEALQQEKDQLTNMAQRLQADFDNFRRRNAQTRADALKEGAAEAVTAMLPVMDNLERAVEAAGEEEGSFLEGVRMVLRQMQDALTKLGVEQIAALGEVFDPERHHAVMQAEAAQGEEPGTVTAVLQKGYTMNGRIIRECMVKVSL